MKRIFKYTIGVVILLAFAACTKEETPIFQEEARVLSITVTDGGYASAKMPTRMTLPPPVPWRTAIPQRSPKTMPVAYTWRAALKPSIPT